MTEFTQEDIEKIKAKADLLGIQYHPNIKPENLLERINKRMSEGESKEEVEAIAPSKPGEESNFDRVNRKARRLVRCRITPMNPNDREITGVPVSVRNKVMGTVARIVIFNHVTHVEACLLEVLKERKYLHIFTKRNRDGTTQVITRPMPAYAIQELPPLTADELKKLAARQAATHSIDEDVDEDVTI